MALPYATKSCWFSLFLLVSLFTLRTTAIHCNFTNGKDYDVSISNQNDIDTKLKGCTEITGSIYITRNYTGAFYLPNVTFISNTILIWDRERLSYTSPALTSIEAPDLVSVGEIHLSSAPSLTTISFPKLSEVYNIDLDEVEAASVNFPSLETLADYGEFSGEITVIGAVSSLNFPRLRSARRLQIASFAPREYVIGHHYSPFDISLPALRNVSSIDFIGNFSRLSLPQLYTVTKDLRIETHGNPLDISLPVLQNASTLSLSGNFSSLSLPLLSSVSEGLDIETYANPIDVSLPILSKAGSVKIAGSIKSISFPLLLTTTTFDLHCATPMNVSLAPLQNITESLYLSGNITAYSLDSIMMINDHYSGEFKIHSDLPLDCDQAIAAWERSNHAITSYNFECGDTDFYQIDQDKKEAKRLFNHRWKMGVGIGLGLATVIGIMVAIWVVHKRVARQMRDLETKVPPPQYELGDLPKYEPRAEDGRSEQGSEVAINAHQESREGNAREVEASGGVLRA